MVVALDRVSVALAILIGAIFVAEIRIWHIALGSVLTLLGSIITVIFSFLSTLSDS